MKKILKLKFADNICPTCCKGHGRLSSQNVGFELHIGDIVEDHCGLLVRIDEVWDKDHTTGWGTTINAPNSWIVGPNHRQHLVKTNNEEYTESLWEVKFPQEI